MKIIRIVFLLFCLLALNRSADAQTIADYLILNNIGIYKLDTPTPFFKDEPPIGGPKTSNGSGILAGTDHFPDHTDNTYEVMYIGGGTYPSPTVKITQHTGGDSDRWLTHEADAEFRTYFGIPDDAYMMRQITTSNIITDGTGGWTYRWLSSNKVINIEYTDLQGNKPEPLEVVQAYLAKYPSTLPVVTSADLRTTDNEIKWIKDEIDRRLWLCDKWNAQFQAGKTTQKDLVYNLNRSIGVFLNYRQKYYGISAEEELAAMGRYYRSNDLTSILTKLTEYKTWWGKHKRDSISLP